MLRGHTFESRNEPAGQGGRRDAERFVQCEQHQNNLAQLICDSRHCPTLLPSVCVLPSRSGRGMGGVILPLG